jgi:WD40 repeat protein
VIRDTLTLLDVDSGGDIMSFTGSHFAEFSPDGRTIATVIPFGAREVLLVDVETGIERLRLHGNDVVCSAKFVDNGSKLAASSYDGVCNVWDSSTGALLRTFHVGARICSMACGRDWVRDTQTGVAFTMGHHPRLGVESPVLGLDEELLRMILDRV